MMNQRNVPEYILHWEEFDRLYYKGDYKALIEMQVAYVKKHSDDLREELLLADAYGYDEQHDKALKILEHLHAIQPYDQEITQALAECLVKLDVKPKSYQWKREVLMFDNAETVTNWCFKYLKEIGKASDTFNLMYEMETIGYVSMEDEKLTEYLKEDGRFMVSSTEDSDYPTVMIKQV